MEQQGLESPTPVSHTVGEDLRQAREAAGLSRADIASQTKIAERHLLAIEENRLSDLAARTYAVGFTRAYARTLGLDEKAYAERVRRQLDAEGGAQHRTLEPSFEPGDPARVPSLRIVGWAALAVLVVIGLVVAAGSTLLSPEGQLPSLLPAETATNAPAAAKPLPVAPPVASGPVVLTALEPDIWLRVTDATGAQLVQKTLAKGESWTVPDGANGPLLRTGRPDALQISLGGKALPLLADRPMTIRDLSLAPAALLGVESTAPPPSPVASAPVMNSAPPLAPRPQSTASRPVRAAAPTSAPATVPSTLPDSSPAADAPPPAGAVSTTNE